MPNFTYDGFLTAASNAGLLGEFSQADLDTARKYPEFGYSILGLKQDIHKATTPEAKLLANEAANQLRSSYGGYTGGKYGADYISDGKIPNQIDSVLDKINGFGSFTFDQERPSYENQYAEQQQALLDAIINRPDFSWSKEDDPQWSSYKKSYLREGDRATANALGQAAAASGGRPSTAALTAATQAGDYYATQLNDIIPTLYRHIEDATQSTHFARCAGNLYLLDEGGNIWITGNIQNPPEEATMEDAFDWMAEFADWCEDSPNKKGVSKLLLRLEVDEGAEVQLFIMFDSTGEWIAVNGTLEGGVKRSYTLPIVPRRGDHYRIKLEGHGGCRVYSLAREYYDGSSLKSLPGRQ